MAKDQTVVGITGKPVPKPRTAKQQYELEKKRRMEKHLGKNVGGTQYKSDVSPYYNPRARTFREFLELTEKFSMAADTSKPQSPKPTALPKSREANVGKHDDWKDKPSTEWGDRPTAGKKLKSRASAVVGTQKRQDVETGVREETETAQKPLTKAEKEREEKKKRLVRMIRHISDPHADVAREEYEIDEAKVEAGKSKEEKREIRTARSGLTGPHADYERRGAHRVADERRKDLADIRKGKKKDSSHFSYLP